jgi:HD-GYP domain-containing protein (c-di-GMP phosphodiesterase class II)
METHPVLGEIIVRKVPQLQDTLPGVRHHHERFDGHGYPDGLPGEEIPRIARILAIADTYDAMNSDRPYRAGLGAEAALDEIERGAGSQFDPEFARAFVNLMRSRQGKQEAA